MRSLFSSLLFLCVLVGCSEPRTQAPEQAKQKPASSQLEIDFTKYTLANGLDVVFHIDRSDPIVSVAIQYHVGSNREVKGRTGFAHLFEHMLFQQSQHVPLDQFAQKIQSAGGTLNGGTWQDGTIYYEVVPNNALEMVLWLEADRMGWLLSTVDQASFDNQQDVVQNEKRQRVDNQPYGHTNYVIDKNMYPEDHPYNWQVIGSLDDIRNATLEDIHAFYKKWYGPNNATLVLAGDFEEDQARIWVEKYFGEIKSSEPVDPPKVLTVSLDQTKKVYHEDNFAKSPELNMVFPTVRQYQKDAYALDALASLLSDGKKAPLYQLLVEERQLAPSVSAWQSSLEIGGTLRFRIRAFPGKSLTEVERAVLDALAKFEEDGFSDQDLARIKTKSETNFYNGIASVLNKSFQLSQYNEYADSPGFIAQDLKNTLAVTREDVLRVYNDYIKGKNYVLTSFVPKGETELVAEGSVLFPIEEENITVAAKSEDGGETAAVEPIPSSFDRTIEPQKGPDPVVNLPTVWRDQLANGVAVLGIEQNELPLVEMAIELKGGLLLEDPSKVGVSNLITDLLMEGTRNKTPIQLQEAIDDLGANVRVIADKESITLWINALRSKFDETLALAQEILLEPRWDEKEFERLKRETIEQIKRDEARPSSVATNVFHRLIYGESHILSHPLIGAVDSVSAITMDDLKTYYQKNFSPKAAHIEITGKLSKTEAMAALRSLEKDWSGDEVVFPEQPEPPRLTEPTVYFVDMPKSKQSELRVGYLAAPYTDPEYFPAVVMNFKLGGGFSGFLNMILREEKGYTYGARSSFSGTVFPGPFTAFSAVRSNVTFESLEIIRDQIRGYKDGISEKDLNFTKDSLLKSDARAYETLSALRQMLGRIANYGLADDFVRERQQIIRDMTLEQHRSLAQKHLPEAMIYLVVGDAETQLEPLKKLGFGDPVLIDKNGMTVKDKPAM